MLTSYIVEQNLIFLILEVHFSFFGALEMTDNDREQEGCVFEIALAVPKWGENRGDEREGAHCVDVLVEELRQNGLIVERDDGLQNEFIKVKILSFHCLLDSYVQVSIFSSNHVWNQSHFAAFLIYIR